jgi:hypothetical protein
MNTINHFDRIRISTFTDPKKLKANLPVEDLAQNSFSFQIQKATGKAHNLNGYCSRLDFSAPSPEFLQILFENEKHLGPYSFSHIEIARDTIFPTKQQAIQATHSFRGRKKWAGKHWTYKAALATDPDKFGMITKYSESKKNLHRSYGRNSKITGQPCFHREWAFGEPKRIYDKTGIREIGDLIAFDHKNFFQIHDKKFLIFDERPDQMKVGKWVLGWTRRKNFSKRELVCIGCHGAAIIGENDFGEFTQKLRKWKREIRAKTGPKTEWDQQLLKVKNYAIFRELRP